MTERDWFREVLEAHADLEAAGQVANIAWEQALEAQCEGDDPAALGLTAAHDAALDLHRQARARLVEALKKGPR